MSGITRVGFKSNYNAIETIKQDKKTNIRSEKVANVANPLLLSLSSSKYQSAVREATREKPISDLLLYTPFAYIDKGDNNITKIENSISRSSETVLSDVEINYYKNAMKEKRLPYNLKIMEVPGLGNAIFLDPDADEIPKDTFLGFYAGSLRAIQKGAESENPYRWGLATARRHEIDIDARKIGNYTRLFNHSESNYNVTSFLYIVEDVPQICFKSCKSIKPGQMLLINYGGEYNWKCFNITKPLCLNPDTYKLTTSGTLMRGDAEPKAISIQVGQESPIIKDNRRRFSYVNQNMEGKPKTNVNEAVSSSSSKKSVEPEIQLNIRNETFPLRAKLRSAGKSPNISLDFPIHSAPKPHASSSPIKPATTDDVDGFDDDSALSDSCELTEGEDQSDEYLAENARDRSSSSNKKAASLEVDLRRSNVVESSSSSKSRGSWERESQPSSTASFLTGSKPENHREKMVSDVPISQNSSGSLERKKMVNQIEMEKINAYFKIICEMYQSHKLQYPKMPLFPYKTYRANVEGRHKHLHFLFKSENREINFDSLKTLFEGYPEIYSALTKLEEMENQRLEKVALENPEFHSEASRLVLSEHLKDRTEILEVAKKSMSEYLMDVILPIRRKIWVNDQNIPELSQKINYYYHGDKPNFSYFCKLRDDSFSKLHLTGIQKIFQPYPAIYERLSVLEVMEMRLKRRLKNLEDDTASSLSESSSSSTTKSRSSQANDPEDSFDDDSTVSDSDSIGPSSVNEPSSSSFASQSDSMSYPDRIRTLKEKKSIDAYAKNQIRRCFQEIQDMHAELRKNNPSMPKFPTSVQFEFQRQKPKMKFRFSESNTFVYFTKLQNYFKKHDAILKELNNLKIMCHQWAEQLLSTLNTPTLEPELDDEMCVNFEGNLAKKENQAEVNEYARKALRGFFEDIKLAVRTLNQQGCSTPEFPLKLSFSLGKGAPRYKFMKLDGPMYMRSIRASFAPHPKILKYLDRLDQMKMNWHQKLVELESASDYQLELVSSGKSAGKRPRSTEQSEALSHSALSVIKRVKRPKSKKGVAAAKRPPKSTNPSIGTSSKGVF